MVDVLDNGHRFTTEDVRVARLIRDIDVRLGRPVDPLVDRVARGAASRASLRVEPQDIRDQSTTLPSTRVEVFLVMHDEPAQKVLTDLLKSEPNITVVGEAGTAAEALRRIPSSHPDVALLDGRLPDGSGIDVCREIRSAHPEIRCVILTSFDDDEALFSAIMAGASGYLLKEVGGSSLVAGIRQVAEGRSLIDPAVTQKLLDRLRNPVREVSKVDALTPREREILDLVTDGYTNRQIGDKLFLAEGTVKNYVLILRTKLGIDMTGDTRAIRVPRSI
ncbi:response regulator [uncultured Friedmanniella sp.]|uniref:response regulator n=1 Tax=uncultured Friedmanniella sp. TaxID=335381 RepID=UPI0035CC0D8A